MSKKKKEISKQHKLFWGSSYDRGLDILLFLWPDILAKFPDAELHIAYGWDLFVTGFHTNPERMAWKNSVDTMMQQDGIFHYGRVGKKELGEIRKSCGIWAYPTYFDEINCITALECQRDGLVPVVINKAALKETVGSGARVEGDIKTIDTQDAYLTALLDMMGDEKGWEEESNKARAFTSGYEWPSIAKSWIEVFEKPIPEPLVTVITCTKREGWWAMMARSLHKQTYKNFEWLILDDHPEDRSAIAEEYAQEYGLTIRYIRGDKVLGLYDAPYGLARANNKAWREARGSLLVFIQDFIMIPERGIEDLVSLHIDNPTALLAPVDEHFFPAEMTKENREDWWPNQLTVIEGRAWRNIRQTFEGVRQTDNPADFEMNYGAVPKATVEALNGWYEFFDGQLSYDNVEFATRASDAGYKIIVDDTNVAYCLEMKDANARQTQDKAYWDYFIKANLPFVRDEKRDTYKNA